MAYFITACLLLASLLGTCIGIDEEFFKNCRESQLNMYRHMYNLHQGDTATPFLISPLSIQYVLGMVSVGADGETAAQIYRALNYTWTGDVQYELKTAFGKSMDLYFNTETENQKSVLANKLFYTETVNLKRSFVRGIRNNFDDSPESMDFTNPALAAERMSQWVQEKTQGQIEDFIKQSDISMTTMLMLINALYFKAEWNTPLHETRYNWTIYNDFYAVGNKLIDGYQTNDFYYIDKADEGILYFAIPYKPTQGYTPSYFLLVYPHRPYQAALQDYQRMLTSATFNKYLPNLDNLGANNLGDDSWIPSNGQSLNFPRFNVEFEFELKALMDSMGVTDLFNPQNANLNKMSSASDLYVDYIKHKATLSVSLNYTEASAATAASTNLRSIEFNQQKKAKGFTISQPCFFGIYKFGNLLFMGQYRND